MLALSRIFLDNFDNLQVSRLTVGLKIGQVGLRFGVNDMGNIMIEENVISAVGGVTDACRNTPPKSVSCQAR